ncbi:bestrophin-like domain [Legionella fallonii]|uniref:DUF4239 domain-containing protein n=1 Tax=Legionella fallonii LLAP-10 TaxID=1212491 RepID=A0A098FZ81_9GAMM|nr:DUF4239 domain-containing protein [Legionella fallonii]CEG55538.1 membrane protein of unknown function [Legionella fallonii LLAP-10]
MIHSLINHCFPTLIFLFYLIVFFSLSRIVFHFKHKTSKNRKDEKTARAIVGSINSFYSIFLGFAVYILWSNYQKSNELIAAEATKLYVISESAKAFPAKVQQNIMQHLTQYVSSILNDELVAMSLGNESPRTQDATDQLYAILLQFKPESSISTYYNNTITSLNQAVEFRNLRLTMLHTGIPVAWYIIIFVGAFLVVGIYALETDFKGRHFLAILCIFLASYMTAITVLSFPFSGFTKVSDKPLQKMFNRLTHTSNQPSTA